MGMDLYAKAPKRPDADYFRNSAWWWRPLWNYACKVCHITEKTQQAGHYNDGHLIRKASAERIARILKAEIASGRTKAYQDAYEKYMASLPDKKCDICHGKGTRNDQYVRGKCNGCGGTGVKRPSECSYPFTVENVQEFANFADDSGGFEIW